MLLKILIGGADNSIKIGFRIAHGPQLPKIGASIKGD
jgi:hypothetical protein